LSDGTGTGDGNRAITSSRAIMCEAESCGVGRTHQTQISDQLARIIVVLRRDLFRGGAEIPNQIHLPLLIVPPALLFMFAANTCVGTWRRAHGTTLATLPCHTADTAGRPPRGSSGRASPGGRLRFHRRVGSWGHCSVTQRDRARALGAPRSPT
jgi:hypothetical protein